MLEEFHGVGVYDHHVVSYLELMKQHYTGCNPRGLLLARDKPLAKKIMSYHQIPTPQFFVVRRGKKIKLPADLEYPLLVKSALEDASLGITKDSIVHDQSSLEDRVRFIHKNTETDALVESFIEGRELYVGVIGNRQLKVFPIWEMIFDYITNNKILGYFEEKRNQQNSYWFLQTVEDRLKQRFYQNPEIKQALENLLLKVKSNTISPFQAAETLLALDEGK